MRAISTVIDAVVFLLLVSAAVATLTLPVSETSEEPVPATADVLATSTAELSYTLDSAEMSSTEVGQIEHRGNGTVARLLADAAVANSSLAGESFGPGTQSFRAAVVNATRTVTGWVSAPIRVDALWRPYPGAPLSGRFSVGPAPPPTADVRAATLRVPGPVEEVRPDAISASSEGFGAVARRTARATVEALFPARRYRVALQGLGHARWFARTRYATASAALGVDIDTAVAKAASREANTALARALTTRLAEDMRRAYPSPRAAARDLRTGLVTVTVRGWTR